MLGKMVCKNLTQTHRQNIHTFFPCLQVLFSHKVQRHTAQMFCGTLPLTRVHPRAKPASNPHATRLDKRQYRIHYRYYLQWMRTVKWCSSIFLTYSSTPSALDVSDMKDKRFSNHYKRCNIQCSQSQAFAAL